MGVVDVPVSEPQSLYGDEEEVIPLCESTMLDIWLVTARVILGKGEWKWRVEAETYHEALQIVKDSGYFCGQMPKKFLFNAMRAAYVESDRVAIVLAEPRDVAALESNNSDQAIVTQVMQGSAA